MEFGIKTEENSRFETSHLHCLTAMTDCEQKGHCGDLLRYIMIPALKLSQNFLMKVILFWLFKALLPQNE